MEKNISNIIGYYIDYKKKSITFQKIKIFSYFNECAQMNIIKYIKDSI